jgi:hypothetical protein
VPNEFDNVIMVAIVITCRANEKEESPKKLEGKKNKEILISYTLCSLFTRGLYDRWFVGSSI